MPEPLPEPLPEPSSSGLNVNEILFILFKHKWKIILSSLAGFAAAAAIYYLSPRVYESQAKILVRYVVDSSVMDPRASSATEMNDSIISTEIEILTSRDLADEVAKAVVSGKLLPEEKSKLTPSDLAHSINAGLSVIASKGSKVIYVSYKNTDPAIVTPVLKELIAKYLEMHLDVHRSSGGAQYLEVQMGPIKSRLESTEKQLKEKKDAAGIVSLSESMASLSARMAKGQEELTSAQGWQVGQRAHLQDMEKSITGTVGNTSETTAVPPVKSQDARRYRELVVHLNDLRKVQMDLLTKYNPEARVVKVNEAQINELENQRGVLEEKYPSLAATAPAAVAGSPQSPQPDMITERARLAAIDARIEALKAQNEETHQAFVQFSDVAAQIAQLERSKQTDEENLKNFELSLQRARIDENLKPERMPNINMIQKPSPASLAAGKLMKIVMGLAGGGLALGLALAGIQEILLDRSIKRPLELETRLNIPLLLSIPDSGTNGHRRPRLKNSANGSAKVGTEIEALEMPPWERNHFIRPYSEALRDRLVLHFELKKMTHKPKLIAVTGCSGGEGSSTIAAGLAASLSETGDGKVLLVDMNVDAEIHPFFEGKPSCLLSEAIQNGTSISSAAENLYLATAPPGAGTSRVIPKRIYDLFPLFKAADFDYVIFDMPPITESSVTIALSGFMDKVVLVVEAEKSNRDVVMRAHRELVAARADVAAIVNKTISHAPKWIEG